MADQRDTTPNKEDLLKLPHWARVAFAARCARRVHPIFVAWKSYSHDHQSPVERAIALSEVSARMGRNGLALRDASVALEAAGAAQYHNVGRVARSARAASMAAATASSPVSQSAIVASMTALLGDRDVDDTEDYPNADIRADRLTLLQATASIWSDYDRLLALSQTERWTDDTPVDPDRLGPLWPFGKPKDWPESRTTEAPPVLQLDIVVPSGMTPKQSRDFNERVTKFHAALSGLHAAMGGTGLRFLDEGSCEMVPAEDEAPFESGSPAPFALSSMMFSAACSGDPL